MAAVILWPEFELVKVDFMDRPIVLVVGHGSRETAANDEFEQLVARYQTRRPQFELRFGYLELAQPSLADALANVGGSEASVTLLPLFLFAAGHMKNDIPQALAVARRERPGVPFCVARALGVHRGMVDLALERAEAVLPLEGDEARRTTVVMVGRGASDADANRDFREVVRMFGESRPFRSVLPCFVGIAQPRFEVTLELAAKSRPERLLVVPFMLFGGRLVARLEEQVAAIRARYPSIKTVLAGHLGAHERLLQVLDERVEEAMAGLAPLPCVNGERTRV